MRSRREPPRRQHVERVPRAESRVYTPPTSRPSWRRRSHSCRTNACPGSAAVGQRSDDERSAAPSCCKVRVRSPTLSSTSQVDQREPIRDRDRCEGRYPEWPPSLRHASTWAHRLDRSADPPCVRPSLRKMGYFSIRILVEPDRCFVEHLWTHLSPANRREGFTTLPEATPSWSCTSGSGPTPGCGVAPSCRAAARTSRARGLPDRRQTDARTWRGRRGAARRFTAQRAVGHREATASARPRGRRRVAVSSAPRRVPASSCARLRA
jgi:hypothetical protein